MTESPTTTVVLYGTPLENLDEDEVPDKKGVQDLTVRDENGRRRFHGAFTGGFSAGYYNTVGTKDGWTPATFESSRVKKALAVGVTTTGTAYRQRPEDFMDQEDLNEFGIAPRTIQTTKKFRDESKETKDNTKSNFKDGINNVIPGPNPLADIVKPTNENQIGTRLLSAMGWKPGQGVGPKIKRLEEEEPTDEPSNTVVKVYGCSLPPSIELSSGNVEAIDEDGRAGIFSFAPEDTPTLPFTPKDNFNGIGYSGLSKSLDLLGDKFDILNPTMTKAVFKTGQKIAIRGQAFGVGALEEDDDYEVYSKDDMTQYDFQLNDGSSSKKKDRGRHSTQKAIQDKSGSSGYIAGFSTAVRPPPPKKMYLPPKVPENFVPMTLLLARIAARMAPLQHQQNTEESTSASPKSTGMFLNRHILNATERAQILGNRFQASEEISNANATPLGSKVNLVKDIEPPMSFGEQSKLKPFASQPDKQKRYEIFTRMQREGRTDFLAMQPSSMTEWEKEKERGEFHRAMVLYRPLASGLSNRFVSTGTNHEQDDFQQLKKNKDSKDKGVRKPEPLTSSIVRVFVEWHPDKLLCKRFNIANPFPDSTLVGTLSEGQNKEKFSIFGFLTTADEKKIESPITNTSSDSGDISVVDTPVFGGLQKEKNNVVPIQKKVDEPVTIKLAENVVPQSQLMEKEKKSTEEKDDRPSIDLFKAIFVDSDSSEYSDVEETVAATTTTMLPGNYNNSLATGVFATLNEPSKKVEEKEKPKESLNMADQSLYGPALPPSLLAADNKKYHRDTTTSVGGKEEQSKKRKKKKKHKKKKSKKSRRDDVSSSDSSDPDQSEEEIVLDKKIIKTYKELSKNKFTIGTLISK